MLWSTLLLLCAQTDAPASTDPDRPIVEWLRTAAVPLPETGAIPEAIDRALADVRVVGLGEATHGQHESFEFKRRLTMHLVRRQGYRIVAYEASATLARACDDYVAGRSNDARAALGGLGMMIWSVQENAAILDDLRAWNAAAQPTDRVRFVGVDVQDSGAAAARLHALLERSAPEFAERAAPLGKRIDEARTALYAGNAADFDALWAEVDALRDDVEHERDGIAQRSSAAEADEAVTRARELSRCMSAARVASGRDRAMAEVLLEDLARAGDSSKAVLWAHNAHVTKGPLGYLNSPDTGMGGVLRATLGDRYYAVGFLFGAGDFNALAVDPERGWGFRKYTVPDAPSGSLEAPFAAVGLGDSFTDLRAAPTEGDVARWLATGHGQRWFGGYAVPDDFAETSRDATRLLPTVARQDFDGLVFLARTSASRPADATLVLPARAAEKR